MNLSVFYVRGTDAADTSDEYVINLKKRLRLNSK